MSAFSAKRRILSLWLPRLPIDRIKRQLSINGVAQADSQEQTNSHDTGGQLPLPLAGEGRGGGLSTSHTVYAARAPTRIASVDAMRPPPHPPSPEGGLRRTSAGEVKRDIPSVVVAKENNALVIYSLDDAAARYGLSAGLPLANARAICPHLQVHDADEAADAKTLGDIADWCDRFTPMVALDAPHGLFLDITGCAHLFGGEAAILRQLCDALTAQGFAVSAAIASTSICARTLNRHAHGQVIADSEEADAVGPLPVPHLTARVSRVGQDGRDRAQHPSRARAVRVPARVRR